MEWGLVESSQRFYEAWKQGFIRLIQELTELAVRAQKFMGSWLSRSGQAVGVGIALFAIPAILLLTATAAGC